MTTTTTTVGVHFTRALDWGGAAPHLSVLVSNPRAVLDFGPCANAILPPPTTTTTTTTTTMKQTLDCSSGRVSTTWRSPDSGTESRSCDLLESLRRSRACSSCRCTRWRSDCRLSIIITR